MMLWHDGGSLIFGMMSAIPPLVAIFRQNGWAFARCLPFSILAWFLAGFTYLVPVAIIVLLVSFALSVLKFKPNHQRAEVQHAATVAKNHTESCATADNVVATAALVHRAAGSARWSQVALLSLFIAMGSCALWLSPAFQGGPPEIFETVFVQGAPLPPDPDQAMTDILNSRFGRGTNEAKLTAALVKQGFRNVPDSPNGRALCRSPARKQSLGFRTRSFGYCPDGTKQLQYKSGWGLVCDLNIIVSWSVDSDGKISRLEASDWGVCL